MELIWFDVCIDFSLTVVWNSDMIYTINEEHLTFKHAFISIVMKVIWYHVSINFSFKNCMESWYVFVRSTQITCHFGLLLFVFLSLLPFPLTFVIYMDAAYIWKHSVINEIWFHICSILRIKIIWTSHMFARLMQKTSHLIMHTWHNWRET